MSAVTSVMAPFRTRDLDRLAAADSTALRVGSAVLVARELVERGWVQRDFFLAQDRRGRTVRVGPMRVGVVRTEDVVGACLVGAVVYGANVEDPRLRHATDLTALDACWDALQEVEGRPGPPTRPGSRPSVRMAKVRDLTRWNDARGRSRDDVLQVLGVAARQRLAPVAG